MDAHIWSGTAFCIIWCGENPLGPGLHKSLGPLSLL